MNSRTESAAHDQRKLMSTIRSAAMEAFQSLQSPQPAEELLSRMRDDAYLCANAQFWVALRGSLARTQGGPPNSPQKLARPAFGPAAEPPR